MSRHGLPRGESWVFTDYLTGDRCFLVIDPDGKPGVRHRNCPVMAALVAELDAFYCMECGYNGRVSGRWAVEIVTARAGCAGDSGAGPGA